MRHFKAVIIAFHVVFLGAFLALVAVWAEEIPHPSTVCAGIC